jgi:hypothetical protein
VGYKYNPFTGELDIVDGYVLPPEVPTQFDADTGSAIPANHVLNLFGTAAQGLVTSAAGDTVTFTVEDATTTQKGVSRLATDAEAIAGTINTNVVIIPSSLAAKLGAQTAKGIPYGAGSTSAIAWTAGLTDGQLVIGSTAGNPAAGAITSLGGTIDVTLGSNTINLETGGIIASSYETDAGTATPAAGILQILGGTGCATAGATNVVTINLDATVPLSFPTDSGTATPALNALSILGGTGCSTSGAGAIVTINLDASVATTYTANTGSAVPIANNLDVLGTGSIATSGATDTLTIGLTGLTNHSLLVGAGTATITNLGVATDGQLPIGSTGADPVLATLTAGTGIGIVNAAGSITISAAPAADNWVDQGSSTTIASNTNYFVTAAATLTLPASPVQGDTIVIDCDTADAVVIQANTGQFIRIGNVISGSAGTATNSLRGDAVTLTYRAATTTWHGRGVEGGWDVV